MTDTTTNFDFNTAGEQRSVIPANTICILQMTVHSGGAGADGWLKLSADGASEGLNCEFTVTEGQYAKKKLWQLFTLRGTNPKHPKAAGYAEAGEISRNTIRAIIESARGINPKDQSDAAKAARNLPGGWAELDQMRFMARLGVRPPEGSYPAKNTILEVLTPDRTDWKKPEQISAKTIAPGAAPAALPTTPPANAIARPDWGK
jgi:hypothetical protein